MRRLTLILLILFMNSPARADLDDDLERFLQWFPGEYDNHEQVWLDGQTEGAEVHEHIHHIFAPVSIPALGENVFYVKQYSDGDPEKVYRMRAYRLSINQDEQAIQLRAESSESPAFLSLYLHRELQLSKCLRHN